MTHLKMLSGLEIRPKSLQLLLENWRRKCKNIFEFVLESFVREFSESIRGDIVHQTTSLMLNKLMRIVFFNRE